AGGLGRTAGDLRPLGGAGGGADPSDAPGLTAGHQRGRAGLRAGVCRPDGGGALVVLNPSRRICLRGRDLLTDGPGTGPARMEGTMFTDDADLSHVPWQLLIRARTTSEVDSLISSVVL